MGVRILSYNIASGGFREYSYKLKKPERLDFLAWIVKKLQPDLVSFIDTFRWDTYFKKGELEKIFGYKHVYCVNLEDKRLKKLGHNNGITIMTNFKNASFQKIKVYSRNTVRTRIKSGKKEFQIFSLYLDDFSEDTRLKQIEQLISHLDKPENIMITGDLNTIAVKDKVTTARALKVFFKSKPSFLKIKPVLDDMLRGEVIEKLKNLGFYDAAIKSENTFPTPLYHGIKHPLVRLDYVFYGKGVKVTALKVLKGKLYQKASDHYPILFEFE